MSKVTDSVRVWETTADDVLTDYAAHKVTLSVWDTYAAVGASILASVHRVHDASYHGSVLDKPTYHRSGGFPYPRRSQTVGQY